MTHVPGIARIVRAATLGVSVRGFAEAAMARGERTVFILGREILPNILGTIFADVGIRLTGSILLIASVNFLGLGLQPPRADWALMISENRLALTIQPWSVAAGEVLGLVGESGSGKTTTALALLGYCRAGVRLAGGSITVAGQRLTSLGERERRRLRGRLISYVPQEPATALNPSVRVGDQIRTMLSVHAPDRPGEDVERVLSQVRLPS